MQNRNPASDINKRTREYCIRIIKLTDRLPRTVAGMEIGKQILRSGASVGANLREAGSGESKKDFVHKIGIARKEALETIFWLEMIDATLLPNDDEVKSLPDESDQIARILYAIGHKQNS